MEVIFGNGLVTGKYVMGFNEVLGSRSDCAESFMKTDLLDDINGGKYEKDVVYGAGSKSKSFFLSDEDVIVLSGMISVVNNVADVISDMSVVEVYSEFYGAVMCMGGFNEEVLIVVFFYLVDNSVQGYVFVFMNEVYRIFWLSIFLVKYYYIMWVFCWWVRFCWCFFFVLYWWFFFYVLYFVQFILIMADYSW